MNPHRKVDPQENILPQEGRPTPPPPIMGGREPGIWSIYEQCISYWNAFLFKEFRINILWNTKIHSSRMHTSCFTSIPLPYFILGYAPHCLPHAMLLNTPRATPHPQHCMLGYTPRCLTHYIPQFRLQASVMNIWIFSLKQMT